MKAFVKHFFFLLVPILIVFVVIDVGMRFFRIPSIQDEAYFFGFHGCPAYFLESKDESGQSVYRTNPDKNIEMTSFPVEKDSEAFRILILGGSAAYGEPFGPDGAFSRWMGDRLEALYPETRFEVINCARKGFGSVRVRNIFDEVIGYDPDLIVLYFGNNEKRDYLYHRIEINVEIRPFFRAVKGFLDHSAVFRMAFHMLFKKRVTSRGAGIIGALLAQGGDYRSIFAERARQVEVYRDRLDVDYGGRWTTLIDSADAEKDPDYAFAVSKLNWRNELPERFRSIFEMNVRHVARAAKSRGIPILFLTRARNCYYNRDDRLLFERNDAANGVIRDVCERNGIPSVETIPELLHGFGDEIGYNVFINDVHLTLEANQFIGRSIAEKIVGMGWIESPDASRGSDFDARMKEQEAEERERFPYDNEYYALDGWRELILADSSDLGGDAGEHVVATAERAIAMAPGDYHSYLAYLLLGTYHFMVEDSLGMRDTVMRMREQFASLD